MKDTKSRGAVVPAAGEERPTLLRRRLDAHDFDESAHAFLGWDADFRRIEHRSPTLRPAGTTANVYRPAGSVRTGTTGARR